MFGQLVDTANRATRSRIVQAWLTALVVPAAATTLHAVGVSTDMNTALVTQGLVDPSVWFILAVCALFGGLGGIVAELLSLHGHIEMPHRVRPRSRNKPTRLADPRNEIDLGIFARIALGSAAALALLAIVTPGGAPALIVNALIAGSAATAVLRLVQGRVLGKSDPAQARAATQPTRSKLSVVEVDPTPVKLAQ
ncbi:MAG TPA: hypothetical protein VGJ60_13205 [Chloroflexota bacterium]|jgi:hypothetical protein